MKASDYIKDIDQELYNFLNEVLEPYEDLPENFYNKNFIPTEQDIKPLSTEQLEYLVEYYHDDASDAIADGEEAFCKMEKRSKAVKELVQKEIESRQNKNSH